MQKGLLTDDNRHEFIDPASLVIKIGVFPPRQKGLIARQSSEIKCLDSTRLTDLFDRIFCPTNSMSLLSGHDFAENPSKFSFALWTKSVFALHFKLVIMNSFKHFPSRRQDFINSVRLSGFVFI